MSAPNIKPINFGAAKASVPNVDELLNKVSEHAKQTNTPKMVFPVDTATAQPAPVAPEPVKTQYRRFTVELPVYLIDDIETRAKGKTRRYVAMKAFRDAGLFVADEDLKEDFRGRRS